MEPSVTTSDIAQLQKLVAEFSSHGDDYVFTHLTGADRLISNQPVQPIRISGMAWILVIKGSFQINLNLDPVAVEAGSVVILMPDTIISERSAARAAEGWLHRGAAAALKCPISHSPKPVTHIQSSH